MVTRDAFFRPCPEATPKGTKTILQGLTDPPQWAYCMCQDSKHLKGSRHFPQTLQHLQVPVFFYLKDKTFPEKKTGVVYDIDWSSCGEYYIGERVRALGTTRSKQCPRSRPAIRLTGKESRSLTRRLWTSEGRCGGHPHQTLAAHTQQRWGLQPTSYLQPLVIMWPHLVLWYI